PGGERHSPHGRPSTCQAANSNVHTTNSTTTYGSIRAMTVPTPAFGSYFIANDTISAKYAFNGEIALTGESPTRYAARTASGSTLSRIRSGTNTGAKIAHFGMEPVMIRSSIATTNTKPISRVSAFRPAPSRTSPSDTAASVARLVYVT